MKKIIYITALIGSLSLCNLINAQTIAAGRQFTLSVCSNGSVQSCGYNSNGQL